MRRGRRGWSLAEALIVVLLAGAICCLVMQLFTSGRKHGAKLSFRLQALQSAHVLRARLFDDLASHCPAAPGQPPFAASPVLRFRRVKSRDGCGVHGTCLGSSLQVLADEVSYEFDARTHRVLRRCNDTVEVVKAGLFLDVSFSYSPFRPDGERGETIGLHVVAVPERVLASAAGVGEETPRVRQDFFFHCPQTTLRRVYREWAY